MNKMRQKTVFIALAAAMFCSATAYAQKVVTEGSGSSIQVIIDARGLPNGAVTTTKKSRTTTGTNSTVCKQDETDIASNINNEKVYQKFEVSQTDNSTSTTTWSAAVYLCAGLATDGGSWRLPTQRELMLIWVLHSQLKKIFNFEPFVATYYWSASESNTSNGWVVDFSYGGTYSYNKTGNIRVRCVRDI